MKQRAVVIAAFALAALASVPMGRGEEKKQDGKALEDRVAALEAKCEALEGRLAAVEKAGETTPPVSGTRREKKQDDPISARLLSKKFQELDIMKGHGSSQVVFGLNFTYSGKKDLRAFKGVIAFKDIFGDVIYRVGLKHDDPLPAGQSKDWQGGVRYNQFLEQDRRLKETEIENLRVEWITEQLLYADGTKDEFLVK